jgi:hypothetical protein
MMHKSFLWRLLAIASLCSTAFSQPGDFFTPASAGTFPPDPLVAEMLAQVQPNAASAFEGTLSGEWPALVDNALYTITSRATTSGLPIQKATQYVYEHMQALGLSTGFHDWSVRGYNGRNVAGTITGTTLPNEIILLTAHLDDVPGYGMAPGADDNASGSVALLLAADILSEYRFARTLRFVFFTGEEQGLLGSQQYAAKVHGEGENIVAVCNLDMIAWDSLDGPVMRLHTRNGSAEDQGIAEVFTNVVTAYNLNLTPVIETDGNSASDHASFWAQGYPAILAIEDNRNDFNRYYHSVSDRLYHLNLAYFNDSVKAAEGTAAHLAGPLGAASGNYRAQLGPPAAMQWSNPSETTTYLLRLTNTGSLTDTYQLSITNNAWRTVYPLEVGPLAAGSSTYVTITVSIPSDTAGGEADIAALTVVSEESNAQVDTAELTTVVDWEILYLPLVLR